MSKIASIAGKENDATQFNVGCLGSLMYITLTLVLKSTASSYIKTWKADAVSSTSNVNFFYGERNTSGLVYNLYADVMLGLGFVPSEVYDILTSYYNITSREPVGFY